MAKKEIFFSNKNDLFLAWFVVGCGIVGAINLAKLAPSMGRLIDYFQIALSTSGLIAGIFSVLMITTGLIGGIIVSKYGPRLAMLLGLFISVLGGVFPVLIPNLNTLMFGRTLEGFGFLLINLSAPVLLSLHTNKSNRGKVMGVWGSFMPAGNALIILIAPFVYLFSDWQLLWEVSVYFAAGMCFLAYFIIPLDPGQFKTPLKEKLSFVIIKTIKKRSIIIVGATFACHSLIFLGNMQFLPYYFNEIAGYSENFSYLATACYCLISFVGHLYCGILLGREHNPIKLISLAFVAAGVFVAFFFGVFDAFITFDKLPIIKLLAIMLAAFLMGLTPPTIFYLVSFVSPPSRITPINYGYMVQIQAIGIFAGSYLYGWLVDETGGWKVIGFLGIFISILGIIGGIISSRLILGNKKSQVLRD